MAGQHQRLLNAADCLDPFKSSFIPGYDIEITLVSLVNNMHQELDRGRVARLILLALLTMLVLLIMVAFRAVFWD